MIENLDGKLAIDLAKNDEVASVLADYYGAIDAVDVDQQIYDSDD